MKIKYISLLRYLLVIFLVASFSEAAEAASTVGGQVNSKGEITFYEGSQEPTTPSSSEPQDSSMLPSSESQDSSTHTPAGQKPSGGSLSNLGDQVGSYSLIGMVLVLFFLLLLLYQRRKNKEEK